MLRRNFLKGTVGLAAAWTFAKPARAATTSWPKQFRIGLQKSGVILIARQQRLIESKLSPLGIAVSWHEFQFGPPLLEALNAGAIDYGTTGDAPPIFAQAAAANLYYVAALPAGGAENAIIVPEASPIKTLSDLKGKKIGFGKGSSAHSLLLAALEQAGVAYEDIAPAYLPPADASAAFARGSIDAWSIWDPFLAKAERQQPTRTLASSRRNYPANTFFLANRAFTDAFPQVIALANEVLAEATQWAKGHSEEAAKLYAEATGVELEVQRVTVQRTAFTFSKVTDDIVQAQQTTANRYFKLGLLPKPIVVKDIVWKQPAS